MGDSMDSKKTRSRPFFAAVVLGTALAAAGHAEAATAAEISGQAIESISKYCTTCWRNARVPVDRWGDCTQEVLRRLLERLEPSAWDHVLVREGEEHREFIRAIDAVKKRTQRERRPAPLQADGIADSRPNHTYRDERAALRQAAETLSPRQQTILRMTCEGWSVADIAREMASTAERVSDEKYKAVQKLRAYFQERASEAS
jgi:RNA polymerase sigma factor (sigma-70 family)